MTATEHDALVRFAAEKMGVEAVAIKEKRYFEPTYPPDSTMASSALSYQEVVTGYVVKGTGQPFDLTSPDLFFKGLRVFRSQGIDWKIDLDGRLMIYRADEWIAEREFKDVDDIPLAFWQAWAEAEGVELK